MSIRKVAITFSIFMLLIIIVADLGYFRFLFLFLDRIPFSDQVLHFLLIGILTYLVTASVIEAYPSRNHTWITIFCVIIFSILFTAEEISQAPLLTRDASLADLAANYIGILFFGFLVWIQYRKKKISNLQ